MLSNVATLSIVKHGAGESHITSRMTVSLVYGICFESE